MKCKKASIATDKPIILIIGLVVLVIILSFIFLFDPDKVFAFFPDFSSANEDVDADIGNIDYYLSESAYIGVEFLDFKERSEEELLEEMDYGENVLKKCFCGKDCENYAMWIVKYSKENDIPDPLLLLSIMMQESSCKKDASSGSSFGLMQVNLVHCGNYGLPEDKEECKKILLENPEQNIRVGARILRDSYNIYHKGKVFSNACTKEYQKVFYNDWKAAIRGYNGWGCDKNYPQQDKYVEEVVAKYNLLYNIK